MRLEGKEDKEQERGATMRGYFETFNKDMYAFTKSRGVQARGISTYLALVLFYIVLLSNRVYRGR